MNEETKMIFEQLKQDVINLHFRWAIYRQLYGSGEDKVNLLNRHGSNVFYLNQFLLLDSVSLTFSKLTDPHTMGRFTNLSLEQLIKSLEEENNNTSLIDNLKLKLGELAGSCEDFRTLRNKRIVHADLGHRLNIANDPLPGISRDYIENALKLLREFMNIAETELLDIHTAYEDVLLPLDADGNVLLNSLRRAESS